MSGQEQEEKNGSCFSVMYQLEMYLDAVFKKVKKKNQYIVYRRYIDSNVWMDR